MLRMNNLVNGSLDLEDLKYLVLEETEFNKYKLSKGDVLFNRTNSFELVGKTSLFNVDGNYTFGSYLVRLVLKRDVILPEFLTLYLNWDKAQNRLKSLAIKAVGQSNISASRIKTFQIPIPLLAEQRQIASFLCNKHTRRKKSSTRCLESESDRHFCLMVEIFVYGLVLELFALICWVFSIFSLIADSMNC
jgi:type I restriction enzyme S subunit